MIINNAITVTTGNEFLVVEKISDGKYQIARFRALEIADIWEAESFNGLCEIMDFITDIPLEDLSEINWYSELASLE